MEPRVHDEGNGELQAVEKLSRATIEGVANRLIASSSFAEFVYREAEMDALFTLVDIAIHIGRTRGGGPEMEPPNFMVPSERHLAPIRELIFAAHDLTHDNRVVEAAELLRKAARLLD